MGYGLRGGRVGQLNLSIRHHYKKYSLSFECSHAWFGSARTKRKDILSLPSFFFLFFFVFVFFVFDSEHKQMRISRWKRKYRSQDRELSTQISLLHYKSAR